MKHYRRLAQMTNAAMLLSLISLAGCQQLIKPAVTVETLYQNSQCGAAPSTRLSAQWLADPTDLQQAWKRLTSNAIPLPPAPELKPTQTGLLIYQGRKNSGGYGVNPYRQRAAIIDKTLSVTIAVIEPAPGAMTSAVMSSPCLLLAIPRDSYNRIELQDPLGNILLHVEQ